MATWSINFPFLSGPFYNRFMVSCIMALLLLLAPPTTAQAGPSASLITPEIKTLARALQHDPDLIYEYVRNNIDYVPYFGSHKGATYTYLAGRGNDFDQSSLMVALLRESGYSAQYVYGHMTFDLQTIASLLGVEADPFIVFEQLEGGGIPVLSVNFSTGGFVLPVVVVKVIINGAEQVAFPWLKGHSTNAKIDLASATGFAKSDFVGTATSGASVGPNSVQHLNETGIRTKLKSYTANLVTTLRNQYPNTEIKNVLGQTTIIPSIPVYNTYSPNPGFYVWDEIPSQITTPAFGLHKLIATITINHNGIVRTFELPEIAGKRLSISYTGAGLAPELRLDGQIVATGSPTVANQTYECTLSINHPYLSMDIDWNAGTGSYVDDNFGDQDNFVSPYFLKSGATNVYAIVSDFGGVSDALLLQRQRILSAAITAGYGNTAEPTLGESLNIVGLNYLKMLSQTDQLTEGLVPKKTMAHHAIGLVAQQDTYYVSMDLVLETIRNKNYEGAAFDVFSIEKAKTILFSAYEHAVLEQMETTGIEAVSTAKLLQLANATGEIIYRADSSNFDAIKPLLVNFTATELSQLQGRINQGSSLIIPRNGNLRLGDWTGYAYVSFREATATNPFDNIGMIIENGLFGGYLAYPSYLSPLAVDDFQFYNSYNTFTTDTIWENAVNFYLPRSIDPVDMASGAFVHEHADLALGGGAPLGLAFGRSYSSNDNLRDNGLGYGWTHNYDIRLIKSSHADPVLGSRSAVDAAPMVAAFQACLEVMTNTNDAASWATAAITAKWATDQLLDNAVTAQLGGKAMEFIKLPDGSYSAPPGITTQLLDNGNGTFSLKERFGTRLDFNTQNRISQLKDADGNAMTFTYSGDLLTSVQDAFGRSLTLSYSGNRVQSVSDSTGRSIAFGYDGDGNLTTYTDPAQKNWLYAYDQAKVCTDPAAPVPPEFRKHRLTSLIDAQSVTTAVNTYDCTGRVDTQTVKRVDAGGALYDVTYNLYFSGYRNVEEDSAGNQSTYYYDRLGRPTDEVNALGQKATKQYDGQNHVVIVTDPRNNTTRYEYDGYNNLVKVINANGETVTHRYDDPDIADDLPLLPVTMSTDPLGNSVRHKYDAEYHRLWSKSYPTAGVEVTTSATYYANGLTATSTDGRGTVTTIVPDAYGTPDTVKTSTHPTVDYNYNTRGQLNNLVDQVGAQTSFLYDNRGMVTRKTDPLLQNVSYQYDNNGNLSQKTDRNNHTITYAYTPSGKPRTITYPNAATVRFTYNSLDRLESMSDSLGTTSYTYDALGRPLTTTDPHGFSLSYAYDAAGNITAITYPGNKTVNYTYDKLNRLTRVSNWLGQAATYAYDGAGRLVSFTNFNGIITTYGFDNASRLTSITSPAASYTFSNLDGNGNPGQVLADEPLAPTVPSGSTSHTYNAPKNRLLTAGSETFTYDNEGQLTTGHGAGYAFDYEHRLTGVGSVAQYRYDGIGNRLEATRNNVTTRYVYDLHGNLIAEADAANTITRYYIHGLGLLSLVTPSGATYCYHFNQIGSTVALTDMTPEMVNQYAYTPFGAIANQTEAIAQPFTFVGQMGVMTEPNGFYYMRARYYDPAVRRFISEDPIGFDGGDLNLYAYAGNNPAMFVDPSGNFVVPFLVEVEMLAARYGPVIEQQGKALAGRAWAYAQVYGPELAVVAEHFIGGGTGSPWPGASPTRQAMKIASEVKKYIDEYVGKPLKKFVTDKYASVAKRTSETTIPLPASKSLPTSAGYQFGSWRKLF